MPLRISDRNNMVLWPGCGGRAEFSLYTKNVRSLWFVVKRRGCCCNLSGGVALIAWFTTNRVCAKNKNIYPWREQAIIEWSRRVISIVACCRSAKLCAHAARDFRSQHNQSRLWSRLHTTLAQVTRIIPNWIYTVFKIFSPFTIFVLALKKQSCPEIFHCMECIFYHSGFLSNSAVALKNRVAQKFFTVLKYLLSFRIFEQLVLARDDHGAGVPELTPAGVCILDWSRGRSQY